MRTVIAQAIVCLRLIMVPALIPTAVRVAGCRGRGNSEGGVNTSVAAPPAARTIPTEVWIVPLLANAEDAHTGDLMEIVGMAGVVVFIVMKNGRRRPWTMDNK